MSEEPQPQYPRSYGADECAAYDHGYNDGFSDGANDERASGDKLAAAIRETLRCSLLSPDGAASTWGDVLRAALKEWAD